MKLFTKLRYTFLEITKKWKQSRVLHKGKRYYSNADEVTEYDDGEYKFIWGVKSPDDLCQTPACLRTMNDIDLVYSRKKKRYILNIETAYWFETQDDVIAYLQSLLKHFTEFMDEQKYDKNFAYRFWMSQPSLLFEEESIPELYTNFRIFVEGYKSACEYSAQKEDGGVRLL